jgi:hypothetical protein
MKKYVFRITAKVSEDFEADTYEEAVDMFVDQVGYASDIEGEVIEEREVEE